MRGRPGTLFHWPQMMLEVVSQYVSMLATGVELTFPRKNFINKIIIGNHSPLRRHVLVALAPTGFSFSDTRIPALLKLPL